LLALAVFLQLGDLIERVLPAVLGADPGPLPEIEDDEDESR
jgi:hypothetical protein